jgi:hypothetical protein
MLYIQNNKKIKGATKIDSNPKALLNSTGTDYQTVL